MALETGRYFFKSRQQAILLARTSFNALERVKTYFRSTMGGRRLSALGFLSAEKDSTESLSKNPEQIGDEFAEDEDRKLVFVS